MWVIAGVLLGLVVLGALAGFHSGPHTHIAAGVLGVVAAVWLVLMAIDGRSAPVLWALLTADLVVSAGAGFLAWKGLTSPPHNGSHGAGSIVGAEGVALRDLAPAGIVRVRGEDWSAVAVNGNVRAGGHVQVLRAEGLRLEVWGEDADQILPASESFSLGEGGDPLAGHAMNDVAVTDAVADTAVADDAVADTAVGDHAVADNKERNS